jgi:hypothetical protein
MAAMSSSVKKSPKIASELPNKRVGGFIARLSRDYPQFEFKAGSQEHWSPKTNTITFNPSEPFTLMRYAVLHELAHALLGHSNYHSDFELLKLETNAWELASEVAQKYKININADHIQNCLDTYRDWLHRRSACPTCSTHVLQKDVHSYQCFNCGTVWEVSSGRFVRPYRKMLKTKSPR